VRILRHVSGVRQADTDGCASQNCLLGRYWIASATYVAWIGPAPARPALSLSKGRRSSATASRSASGRRRPRAHLQLLHTCTCGPHLPRIRGALSGSAGVAARSNDLPAADQPGVAFPSSTLTRRAQTSDASARSWSHRLARLSIEMPLSSASLRRWLLYRFHHKRRDDQKVRIATIGSVLVYERNSDR
jgi:hypothetical protein